MHNDSRRESGDLEILEEITLAELPRGDDLLRVTLTRARGVAGKEISWHSLRIFWKRDQGDWKPGRQGITIRERELRPVVDALMTELSAVAPPRIAAAPSSHHRTSRASDVIGPQRSLTLPAATPPRGWDGSGPDPDEGIF